MSAKLTGIKEADQAAAVGCAELALYVAQQNLKKGGNFLVVHNPGRNPPPPTPAVIDHVCYTISNWDEGKVRNALKNAGTPNPGGRNGSLHFYDPFDYDVQIANDVEETPYRRGR